MKFAAKVDWWIGASLFCGIAIPAIAGLATRDYYALGASAFAVLLVFGCCYPQWYETTSDLLIVRAGFITRRIPYSKIYAVSPSADSRSSLALSLDRVEIEYENGDILIAMKDQPAFFDEIARHSPQLTRQGQALVAGFNPPDPELHPSF